MACSLDVKNGLTRGHVTGGPEIICVIGLEVKFVVRVLEVKSGLLSNGYRNSRLEAPISEGVSGGNGSSAGGW